MTTIKIDSRDYDFDTLSDEAKTQLVNLQFVDAELQRLQAQAAVLQTARSAYLKALQQALNAAQAPTPSLATPSSSVESWLPVLPSSMDNIETSARHWDQWQAARTQSRQNFTDWGDHPTVLELIYQEVFGSTETGIIEYLLQSHPELSGLHALSLCSGDGAFERHLLSKEVFKSMVGMDISPTRVEQARQDCGDLAPRLEFRVGDVNKGDFGHQTYDAVFAKAALHHVVELETLVKGIHDCLRPGGCLVTIDFFGPTRFQWTDAQLAAANQFLADKVPRHLLRKLDGSYHDKIVRPTIEAMIGLDPSEAVRSGELHALLEANFSIDTDIQLGGTLLNLIFYGDVVNNFDPADEQHNQIIREAFAMERSLMSAGEIGSDFRLIVARGK